MKSHRLRRTVLFSFILTVVALPIFSMVSNFYYGSSTASAQSLTGAAPDYGLTVTGGTIQLDPDQYTLRWINAAELEVSFKGSTQKLIFTPENESGGRPTLVDQRMEGVQVDYEIKGFACYAKARADTSVNDPITEVDIDIDFKVSSLGECTNIGTINNISPQNPELSIAYFQWIDSATIQPVGDLSDDVFRMEDPNYPNLYVSTRETGSCRNKILVDKTANTMRFFDLNDGGAFFDNDPPPDILAGSCKYREYEQDSSSRAFAPYSNFEYPLASRQNSLLAAGTGTLDGGDTSIGTVTGDENPTCETSNYGLTWALCPLINGALDATDWFFRAVIEPYLRINPIQVDNDDFVYQIWSSFRTIGNILLVFGLLFIVFGQAIGGGLVDAYTAKKALPRILLAAILINLSIYIVAIMVDISNVVGMGLGQLITAPLQDNGSFNFNLGTGSALIINITGALPVLIGGGLLAIAFKGRGSGASVANTASGGVLSAIGSAIVPIMFFVVVPMLVAAIAVFGTLVIRRGIVLFLAIVSPVAMALYTLPSTEKYAKQWFNLLVKTLMMYPIIIAIFAIGDVLGTVILNSGTDGAIGGQLASTLTGLMVLFAPMFMIPFSFKLAGSAISTIYGTLTKSDKLIRGDKHDVHGRYHRWSNSARERGKEAMDAGLARAGGTLATWGSPGRVISRATQGASDRTSERALKKAYLKHYKGWLSEAIDPTTGAKYTDPGKFEDWVRAQRAGTPVTPGSSGAGGGGPTSPWPPPTVPPGSGPTPPFTGGSTTPTPPPPAPLPAPKVPLTPAPPSGPSSPPPAGAVIAPSIPTPRPPSGTGSTLPPPPSGTGSTLPPPTTSDSATGALTSAAGEVRAAAGELREAARRISSPESGSTSRSSAVGDKRSPNTLNIPKNSSTGGPSFS